MKTMLLSDATPIGRQGSVLLELAVVLLLPPPLPAQDLTLLCSTAGQAQALAKRGDTLYVGQTGFITVFDVSDSQSPQHRAQVPMPETVRDLAIEGDRLYAAVDNGGLQIVSLAQPIAHRLISSHPTADRAYAVDAVGDLVYVLNDEFGLEVFDATDPAAPQLHGTYQITGGNGFDVLVEGDFAYIANGGGFGGLVVLDVSDPTDPTLIVESVSEEFVPEKKQSPLQ